MPKKIIIFLLGFIFLFGFKFVYAGVVINEIQISPTEGRFIELYNQGNESIDLTDWYIQRKTQTGSSFSSLVSKTYFENKKINANGYFVISRNAIEKSDLVLGTLTLTESNVIQLKNAGGEAVDKVCYGDVSDCVGTTVPNPNEGQSVGRNQNNSFVIGVPTPGVQNYSSSNNTGGSNENNISNTSDTSISSSTQVENKAKAKIEVPKIKIKIESKNLVFTGIPLEFSASATGYSGEPLFYGKYFWNFGDGDSKEVNANSISKFTHTFFYEGEYTVALEYYMNYNSSKPDAVSEITINVIKPDIVISRVGDDKDFFIEISNNTDYDADLSKWILSSGEKNFMLPKNMILGSGKEMILSPKITGFSILDKDNLKLLNSEREIIFDYSLSLNPQVPLKNNTYKRTIPKIEQNTPLIDRNTSTDIVVNDKEEETLAENLLANAVNADVKVGGNLNYGILGLIVLFGISISAVYYIRTHNRKPVLQTDGSDFEILDE